jgi:hypothetical protein
MILNIFNFAVNNSVNMIQRIQTIYLFIAELLIASLFIAPLAEFAGKDGKLFLLTINGVFSEGNKDIISRSWPLFIMVCLILILLTVAIFQYKNRIRQINISYLTAYLLFGLTAAIFFFIWRNDTILEGTYALKIYFTFPLISAIFIFMAIRGIAKDEHLVKSIDRIR